MSLWRKLQARVSSMISRGIVTKTTDTEPTLVIQVEIRADEMADAIELLQPYGLSFRPTVDSEVLVLAAGAAQDQLCAINATNRNERPTESEEGEGGLYTPTGWKVYLDKDDNVRLTRKDADIPIARADRVEEQLSAIEDAHNKHTHKTTACGGGTSSLLPHSQDSKATEQKYTAGEVGCDKVFGD